MLLEPPGPYGVTCDFLLCSPEAARGLRVKERSALESFFYWIFCGTLFLSMLSFFTPLVLATSPEIKGTLCPKFTYHSDEYNTPSRSQRPLTCILVKVTLLLFDFLKLHRARIQYKVT